MRCMGWFDFTKFFGFILFFPEILKKATTTESFRRSCQVENVPLLEAAGSAPLTAPAELQSEAAARAATRRSLLLRLCLSKPVTGGIYAAAGPSDSCESTEPLPPPSAESALVQRLRPGCTSWNPFDVTAFQIAMTERFCQQCSWRCRPSKNQAAPLKMKGRQTTYLRTALHLFFFPQRDV